MNFEMIKTRVKRNNELLGKCNKSMMTKDFLLNFNKNDQKSFQTSKNQLNNYKFQMCSFEATN